MPLIFDIIGSGKAQKERSPMKPTSFSKYEQVLLSHEPEFATVEMLTSFYGDGTPEIITCWKVSWWERIKILFGGKLLIHTLSLGFVPTKASVDFEHVREIERCYNQEQESSHRE